MVNRDSAAPKYQVLVIVNTLCSTMRSYRAANRSIVGALVKSDLSVNISVAWTRIVGSRIRIPRGSVSSLTVRRIVCLVSCPLKARSTQRLCAWVGGSRLRGWRGREYSGGVRSDVRMCRKFGSFGTMLLRLRGWRSQDSSGRLCGELRG